MYELYDECTIMFFHRNKHIMIDLGTGNNNKVRSDGSGWSVCFLF